MPSEATVDLKKKKTTTHIYLTSHIASAHDSNKAVIRAKNGPGSKKRPTCQLYPY